jgi:hypothetical protein
MAHEIKTVTGNVVSPVGSANPVRGANHHEAAMKFIQQFPVGTELTSAQFDSFVVTHGMIKGPSSYERSSDGWQAFLQRRHQAKINLNKAGSHPRMSEYGGRPFCIVQMGVGTMVVKTPFEAAVTTPVGRQVDSLVETKNRALRHLLESVDFTALPANEQAQVQNLYETLSDYKAQIEFTSARLSDKFDRLKAGVERLVNEGKIKPQNGGIKALIDSSKQGDLFDGEDADDQDPMHLAA